MNKKFRVVYKKTRNGRFVKDIKPTKKQIREKKLLRKYFNKWYNYTFFVIRWDNGWFHAY